MATPFSFSFTGDDIENDDGHAAQPTTAAADPSQPPPPLSSSASTPAFAPASASTSASASAFPVQGKPLLPPIRHDIDQMLARLPSKIAYGLLSVTLGDDYPGSGPTAAATIQLPRRELWDVRVQLMAEEEDDDNNQDGNASVGLGEHDVKTGIYEGGFKSWESSVDLVKVLASEDIPHAVGRDPCVLIELGCGTGLPSLAMFQWALAKRGESSSPSTAERSPLVLTLADYNPSVLYLVTLPNFILTWALQQQGQLPLLEEAFSSDGELELTAEVVAAFKSSLDAHHITLSFLSGAWSPEFVDLLYQAPGGSAIPANARTLVLGAETIYSPFALESFVTTLLSILERERRERPGSGHAAALIGAKRLYFGVGGSLDDFVDRMRGLGATVDTLREETEGVRRGVVRCILD
ncbi:hypothetical protein B0T26DRAFT_634539 [Lasiosphaeria miniovina]|uniref:protein-histidine N-methyltransferase n=1 Tax=Lasiosphaeria miniovina TaxID=1954250 RepID=A0AA40BFX3_9PEZI|nr:uncharacterized protein B0T26DRAFT_634539 [Lasiosphaeria miniovina]KAK0733516.1 hypothetical protein B0T26DRAFT_634539 [Lasiosphaeria miniovina]